MFHPFSHPGQNPDHVARLASYWAEVFGGPPTFSQPAGDHSAMLDLHARIEADDDLGDRSYSSAERPERSAR